MLDTPFCGSLHTTYQQGDTLWVGDPSGGLQDTLEVGSPLAFVRKLRLLYPPPHSMLGLTVDRVTQSQVVDLVVASSRRSVGGAVFSVNLDTLRQAHERPDIFRLLQSGDLRIADGMPIIWAGRLSRAPFPERVAGSSLVPDLAARAAHEGMSVYLLGGNEGTARGAADVLVSKNPGLRVAGTDCPPVGFERSVESVDGIRSRVLAARPDLVFVGLGFPKQEHLIDELRHALPATWFVSCGITFSFIVGDVARAPLWMQQAGLEWFHRFTQEPKRLFQRYFVEDVPFLATLLRSAWRDRQDGKRAKGPGSEPPCVEQIGPISDSAGR